MLASLLPGLRDVRAPLAAGYLWLLAGYIAFEPLVARRPRGIWETISRLDHRLTLSALGTGVAISFLAYIVGALSQTASRSLLTLIDRLTTPAAPRPTYMANVAAEMTTRRLHLPMSVPDAPVALGPAGEAAGEEISSGRVEALAQAMQVALKPKGESDPIHVALSTSTGWGGDGHDKAALFDALYSARHTLAAAWLEIREKDFGRNDPTYLGNVISGASEVYAREHLTAAIRRRVTTEARLARISLLGKEPEVFSEVDRLQSEAEFRTGIALPIIGLGIAMLWRATWWSAAILLIVAVALAITGRSQARRANDALFEALRLGRATTPTLDGLDNAIARLRELEPPRDQSEETPETETEREERLLREAAEVKNRRAAEAQARHDAAAASEAQARYDAAMRAGVVDTSMAWQCPACTHSNRAGAKRCAVCRREF